MLLMIKETYTHSRKFGRKIIREAQSVPQEMRKEILVRCDLETVLKSELGSES